MLASPRVSRGVGADLSGAQDRVDAHDVGDLAGQAQHLRPATAHHDRRARPLHRFGHRVVAGDRVVLTGEVERAVTPRAQHDLERFCEPIDAHARRVVRQTERGVVAPLPPGAEPEFEPPAGEHVERRRLLRHRGRVLVVVAEHERADAQGGGGRGREREADHRREVGAHVMVGHEQRGVAETLGAPRVLGPLGRVTRGRGLHPEAERTGHGCTPLIGVRWNRTQTRRGWWSRATRPLPTPRTPPSGSRAARCDHPGAPRTPRPGRC